MVKQLSNFFKKDSAGPVVIMAQGSTEAPAETPVEVPAPEAPAAETPAEVPAPEAETPAETPAPAAAVVPAAQVSISAERLAALEGFERELNAMRPKYEVLEAWYNNVKGQGAGVGKDASEAAGSSAAKSWEKAPWNN